MKAARLAPLSAMLVTLGACGGPIDVRGQVTYLFNDGAPVANARVKVGSKAVVTTDADGRFAVSSVDTPYDVTAVAQDGSVAEIYLGLTRNDPTIAMFAAGLSPAPHTATVTGQISGGAGIPLPPGHVIAPVIVVPIGHVTVTDSALDDSGNYSLSVSWQGQPNLTGTIRALEWAVDAGFNATSYDGAGSAPLTLVDGKTSSGVNLSLTPVPNTRSAGTVSTAPGHALLGHALFAAFSPFDSFDLVGGGALGPSPVPPDPSFDYPVLSAPGIGVGVAAFAQDSSGGQVSAWKVGLSPGATNHLNVPAAPVLQPPVPSTAVTIGTKFSWSPVNGAVYRLDLGPGSPARAGSPTLDVVTGATSFQLPDLSSMGISWPRSTNYEARLTAASPLRLDDMVGGQLSAPLDHDGTFAFSASVQFTTAP